MQEYSLHFLLFSTPIKVIFGLLILVVGFSFNVSSVFAHAVVKPAQVGVGSFTDFSLGVPSEKSAATIRVKLTLPQGLNYVSPVVKPGWQISVTTSTEGAKTDENGNLKPLPTEIIWSGGQIPGEQKDFFQFSAQAPSEPTELFWNIEQTYSDGSVITWNLKPNEEQPKDASGKPDYSKFGPASKSIVINDLAATPKPITTDVVTTSKDSYDSLSLVALVLAVVSLVWQFQSRKKKGDE